VKIILRAHGSIKSGPERELTSDYIQRAQGLARATGFLGVEEQEIDTRGKSDRTTQTQALLDGIPDGAHIILLDERGKSPTSRQIARHFADKRDEGIIQLAILIGPADGFDPALLPSATRWSFGAQTWPHKLVRVLAAEQIFRALSILAGTPYHRD